MDLPKKGLVIDEPYISMILNGQKTWEMRSQRTGKRERIGLIKKGSSAVFGTIELFDCDGPLNINELKQATDFHGITKSQIDNGLLDKWNYAWKLRNVEVFDKPIIYKHPNGAVTWVDLERAFSAKVQIKNIINLTSKTIAPQTSFSIDKKLSPEIALNEKISGVQIPYAKDGTSFSIHLNRGGYFTVGEKGAEQKIEGFDAALKYLKQMKTAKWRRPNDKGNWGIVSAVEWKQPM